MQNRITTTEIAKGQTDMELLEDLEEILFLGWDKTELLKMFRKGHQGIFITFTTQGGSNY